MPAVRPDPSRALEAEGVLSVAANTGAQQARLIKRFRFFYLLFFFSLGKYGDQNDETRVVVYMRPNSFGFHSLLNSSTSPRYFRFSKLYNLLKRFSKSHSLCF
jgi:hypothetical protein